MTNYPDGEKYAYGSDHSKNVLIEAQKLIPEYPEKAGSTI